MIKRNTETESVFSTRVEYRVKSNAVKPIVLALNIALIATVLRIYSASFVLSTTAKVLSVFLKMGAGKQWPSEENLLCCKAYARASEASKNGKKQKTHRFLESVEVAWNALVAVQERDTDFKLSQKRSGSSVNQRFKAIRKSYLKYEQMRQLVLARKPIGGPTDDDVLRTATALLNGVIMVDDMYDILRDRSADAGKPFMFINCYLRLRGSYLWREIEDTIAKVREINSVDGGTASNNDNDEDFKNDSRAQEDGESGKGESVAIGAKASRRRGVKRTSDASKALQTIEKSARMIEGMIKSSEKRTKIVEGLARVQSENGAIQKGRYLLELFSMEGTPAQYRAEFMRISQKRALEEMTARFNSKSGVELEEASRQHSSPSGNSAPYENEAKQTLDVPAANGSTRNAELDVLLHPETPPASLTPIEISDDEGIRAASNAHSGSVMSIIN